MTTKADQISTFMAKAKALCAEHDIPLPWILSGYVEGWYHQKVDLDHMFRRVAFALQTGRSLESVDAALRERIAKRRAAERREEAGACEKPGEASQAAPEIDPQPVTALAIAESFLRERLADGPATATTVRREAAKAGITGKTLERARKSLTVITRRVGFGAHSYSTIQLPW
jgi:hypothetical protein